MGRSGHRLAASTEPPDAHDPSGPCLDHGFLPMVVAVVDWYGCAPSGGEHMRRIVLSMAWLIGLSGVALGQTTLTSEIAPGGKLRDGHKVCLPGIPVSDVRGEEFPKPPRAMRVMQENDRHRTVRGRADGRQLAAGDWQVGRFLRHQS